MRFEEGRPLLLGGLRQRHTFAASTAGIPDQWRRFLSSPALPGRVGESHYGVMCGSDGVSLEYMCAVEVASLAELPEGTGRMRVPAQQYAVFAHSGEASTLRHTWQQILDWLAAGPYDSAHKPDFELYPPGGSPAAATSGIEVWIGVVPR
jgi:predicted transcriptional regulator YdeE